MKLSKREKQIAGVTIGLLVFSLLVNFVFIPTARYLKTLNSDIEKKALLLRRYTRLVGRGEDILRLYDNYKEIVQEDLSSQDVVAQLFKEMESSAQASGLKVQRIKPLPVKSKRGYNQASLEVEVTGNLGAIFTLIEKIEKSPAFIRVAALRLLPEPKDSSQLRCRMELVKFFF